MKAYMVDNYYIFPNYKDLSSHIHDVIHFSRPNHEGDSHSISVMTGEVDLEKMIFINEHGCCIPLKYEQEYNLYYCAFSGEDYSIELNTANRV